MSSVLTYCRWEQEIRRAAAAPGLVLSPLLSREEQEENTPLINTTSTPVVLEYSKLKDLIFSIHV